MKGLILMLIISLTAASETPFKLTQSNGSIIIAGTSSIHEWESEVTRFEATGELEADALEKLSLTVEVKSIESGKGIMDDKTYEALKADKFPKITCKAEKLIRLNNKLSGNAEVTIAGVTKTIPLAADISFENGSTLITGTVPIDMTLYNIEPPTAMFGTLETGKDVKIHFKMNLKQ